MSLEDDAQARRRRYGRQMLLPEIGEAGQERLARVRVEVGPGLAGDVEARYLTGAGVGVVTRAADAPGPSGNAPSGSAHSWREALGDPAARAVAEGACRALQVIRREVLGGGDGP